MQFSGLEKDEVIPKEWLERMDFYQHKLTADIKWDVGDVLVIDVSELATPEWSHLGADNHEQNYAAQHARWAWEGERKILASFWDQPGCTAKPMASA